MVGEKLFRHRATMSGKNAICRAFIRRQGVLFAQE
jgi:hypothetical protein